MTKLILNQGQQKGVDTLLNFIAGNDKFIRIEGPAGVGKTTMLGAFENRLSSMNSTRKVLGLPGFHQMYFAATTNKASSLFGDASTIHKLFGFGLRTNYSTGKINTVATNKTETIHDSIVVIDEASMLNQQMHRLIDQFTSDSRIVYMQDGFQLAPVGDDVPYISSLDTQVINLTEPMRQDKDSHLYIELQKLRAAVEQQVYAKLTPGPGIEFMSGPDFIKAMVDSFKQGTSARVVAYRNERVEDLNRFIRKQLGRPTLYGVGDLVVPASQLENSTIKRERVYHVDSVNHTVRDIHGIECYTLTINNESVAVPVDKKKYFSAMKKLRKEAKESYDWRMFYEASGSILDLRDGYACTAHAAQGSTYDTVFIDFTDMCKATDLNMFLRMLYVAASRARTRVVIHGM